MSEKLILGISGSPRKGANTDILLAEAMKAAEETAGIRTETIYLRDYEIHNCKGCFACCREPGKKDGGAHACAMFRDGMDEIYPKLKECAEKNASRPVPGWMTKDLEKMSVVVDKLPDRADIDFDVAEHLIVELYSK